MTTRLVFMLVMMLATHLVYPDEFVDRADANGDGFVSLYELRAAHYADPEFNKRIEQSFGLYDRNGDGLISKNERQTQRAEIQRAQASNLAQNRKPPVASRNVNVVLPDRGDSQDTDQNRKSQSANVAGAKAQSERAADPSPVVTRQPERRVESTSTAGPSGNGRLNGQRNVQGSNTVLSRNESWIMEIDADRSGGASMAELIASADGQSWFSKADFQAADKNDDDELDADELAALVSSLERRHR